MTDTTSSDRLLARTAPSNGRPVRKDEIELVDRGLYIESWLPERRSRRKPILFVHGELGGSWVWERYLQHFAGRGWEGHALNLRNHFWSRDRRPRDARRRDVHGRRHRGDGAARARRPSSSGTGWAACWRSRPLERVTASAYVLIAPELPQGPARPRAPARRARRPGRLRAGGDRLGDAAREAPPRAPGPHAGRRAAHPAHARPEAVRVGPRPTPGAPGRAGGPRPRCPTSRASSSAPASTRTSPSRTWSGSPNGSTRRTSRSAPTRTTASCSASRAICRSPRRCGCSSRRTACRGRARDGVGTARRWREIGDLGILRHRPGPPGRRAPHSSRGLGHRPLKAEITGSNPVCGTNSVISARSSLGSGFFIACRGPHAPCPDPTADRDRAGRVSHPGPAPTWPQKTQPASLGGPWALTIQPPAKHPPASFGRGSGQTAIGFGSHGTTRLAGSGPRCSIGDVSEPSRKEVAR